ncbi:MAG: xylulokinase [Gammaproteobacteria bacterium]|nr:xylulokinase [Gammaproteobacteria bacterium]
MKTVVGIDLGTQSLKVLFYDFARREIVAAESAGLELHQDDEGAAEQQAGWWLNALHEALGRIDPSVRRSAVAVGVSGQQHGFVPLARDGEVLAPVKLWCDTSTVPECDEITEACGGAEQCLEEIGNLILPGYTASKIRWFAKAREELYQRLDCILLPHDYLNFYLTGERCMEAGDASGTGFLDIRQRRWSKRALGAIDDRRDLSECLPPLRTEPGPIGALTAEAARRTGLPPGIPVSTGGGDNMMGAIGTGNVSAGKVTMSLGTSGTVYACSDRPVIDPRGEIAAFCSSTGGWLPLMCTMNCTVTTELMRGLLDSDIEQFESRVGRAPRGAEGVITLPFFNGERTPNLPRAKACIIGLDSRNTGPDNLLRSALEGATFALRYGIDRLKTLGIHAGEILLTGGGVGSATWRQVVADVCDAPVTVLEQNEGASFGAALQALALIEGGGSEGFPQLVDDHLSRDGKLCCEPSRPAVNQYEEAYGRYRDAVAAITPLYS